MGDGEGGAARVQGRIYDACSKGTGRENPYRIDRYVALEADGRPIAGLCLRHILVDAAELRAGGIQIGIVSISRSQCVVERVGNCGLDQRDQRCNRDSGGPYPTSRQQEGTT